jgi:histidinol-phosphate aminotransferase
MSFERENIRRMSGYVSGEQPDDDRTLKLNTNENPYPPSESVTNILREFDPVQLRRYPPPTAARFRELAARLHGVDTDNVIATRGGDELLRLVITTFVDPGQPIGMTNPTYSLYPVLAQIQDCPLVEVDLNDSWQPPSTFAQQMNDAGVKLTLLVNPHAPSGILLDTQEIGNLADELDSILLLDEAYVDFVGQDYDSAELIDKHDNLIILRTLSKGYSLAGLRFGYGLGASSLIEPMLTKTRDSYNLDLISQQIAEAALADQTTAGNNWHRVIEERERLRDLLAAIGLPSPASHTNFLLVSAPEGIGAEEIYKKLKERYILVRYFASPRLSDKLRITIGTRSENEQLLAALTEILGNTDPTTA